MTNKLEIKKFTDRNELIEITKDTKHFISYLVFFSNSSGYLKINHIATPIEQYSIANLPILSTIKFDNLSENTNGWCVAFNKEARDLLLIHSFKLFCPFTGITNVFLQELIFNKLIFYLKEIQNEISTQETTFSEIIYLQSALIIKYINRSIKNDNSTSQIDDKMLRQFADMVSREYKNNHNVDFYTKAIGVTTKTLNRLTKQKLNITPKQIIQYRINAEAIRMLIHTNESIKEIAYELNFSSPDYFNYFFKKINKISPTGYKKKMLKNMKFSSLHQ